jgi:hypothetical protein
MKFLKVGRVAIITRGRYAGKKVRNPISIVLTAARWRNRQRWMEMIWWRRTGGVFKSLGF